MAVENATRIESRIGFRVTPWRREILLFLFNLVGLPSYASYYDQFLILMSLGINVLIVWCAWNRNVASAFSIGG